MVIGVLGGTGQAGRAVEAELRGRGHRAIVLSRSPPATGEHRRVDVVNRSARIMIGVAGVPSAYEFSTGGHRRVDVATGEGLAAAMAGLDAVVDVLNGGETIELAGPRVERAGGLARDWARGRGVRRLCLPVPPLGAVLGAVRDSGLIAANPSRGRISFAEYLARRAPTPPA